MTVYKISVQRGKSYKNIIIFQGLTITRLMFDVAFCVCFGKGQKETPIQIVIVTQYDKHSRDYGNAISPKSLADNDSSKEQTVNVDVQFSCINRRQ